MPAQRNAYHSIVSSGSFVMRASLHNRDHFSSARDDLSHPYPSYEDVYLCSNMSNPVTGYPLSLPSETLPLLPSSPARSFCDLRVLATSQRILPPFAETASTPPFHSATSFASPNSRPHGLRTPASCPRLRLRYIFAPPLYPTSLAP